MDTDRLPDFEANCSDRSAQVIQIDNGKAVAAVAVCAAICGLSLAVALWAGYQAQLMTTEYRITTNHVMELEARQKLMEEEHGNR